MTGDMGIIGESVLSCCKKIKDEYIVSLKRNPSPVLNEKEKKSPAVSRALQFRCSAET